MRAKNFVGSVLAVIVSFLAACTPPEWQDENGTWGVEGVTVPGQPSFIPGGWAELQVALDTIHEMGPCGTISDNWWGGHILFEPSPLGNPQNAGIWVGCYSPKHADFDIANVRHTSFTDPGTPLTRIEETALVHEWGHYGFSRCGLPNLDHPPEFYVWVNAVNAEIARRLGR